MLTAKENMIECMKGGNPDRFVNQYEAVNLVWDPYTLFGTPIVKKGDLNVVSAWGVTNSFPENTPGVFPVHTPDKIVVKDIEHWHDYVHAPSLKFTDEQWGAVKGMFDAIDGNKAFKAIFVYPGLFEMTHHLCEMTNALIYYMEYEDEMHDLLRYLTDWELEKADGICSNLHPDVLFHHDDWGSLQSTFMSVSMFEDYFEDLYIELYGYYKSRGVKYVIHHSDSYAATLVPSMIRQGVDVFQGCMETNKVDELLKTYGSQITYMGCIENKACDTDDWTDENCEAVARRVCETYGMKNFIPCLAQGNPGSVYPGVYESLTKAIDKINMEKFGVGDPAEMRNPVQIM